MAPRLTSRTIDLRRVVVTGLGTVNPLGNDAHTTWSAALKGVSGASLVDRFPVDDLAVKFAAQVRDFDPSEYLGPKDRRRLDPFIHFAVAAAHEAVEDSGLELPGDDGDRVGVLIGSGIAGLEVMHANVDALLHRGAMRTSPFWVVGTIANMASGVVSMRYGARGPNSCVVTACSTGTHSIGDACRIIQRGEADVMLAGGAEACANRMGMSGFATMRALSTRNDDPQGASRPFDLGRDGFVIGEGAGVLVLESLERALDRGARIHAEVIGYGMSGDAHHMTAPDPKGRGAQLCMQRALDDAGLAPEQIDYINAHGTSTELNDKIETRAIREVFGAHADSLPVSSTKSMTGHLLGAAGGLEALFCALAVRDGKLPPTINYEEPDPECDLDYVPNEMREVPIRVALSNSFGFGGTNAALVIARYDGE